MRATANCVLMGTLLFLTAGCGNDTSASARSVAAAGPASEVPVHTAGSGASASVEAPLLADEVTAADPDPAMLEDAATGADGDGDDGAIDILAEDSGAAIFTPVATTSLSVTAEDVRYEQLIAQHTTGAPAADATLATETPTQQAPVTPVAPADPAQHDTAASIAAPARTPSAPMEEKEILKDKNGQWAVSAKASSTYAQSPGDKAPYSAWQATGAPNVPRYSDDGAAWASKSGDSKDPEWLEVTFARPVHATAIRIRQNTAPGAIAGIELIDERGQSHPLWSGTDATDYAKNSIGWLIRDIPRTDFKVRAARITLMTARVWGWNEIDAVQLVGEP